MQPQNQENTKQGEKRYKGAIREYTLLGISGVFKTIMSKQFKDFFGGKTLSGILAVIRNGEFYHFQIEREVKELAESYLKHIVAGQVDLNAQYIEFEKKVIELEKIYKTTEENLTEDIITRFFKIYSELIKYVYASAYSLDEITILEPKDQEQVRAHIEKMRIRGENIYKFGEMDFINRITAHLASTSVKDHTANSLQYLTENELLSRLNTKTPILTNKELEERKKLVIIEFQYPKQLKLSSGKEAERIIEERKLFIEIDRHYKDIKEIQGITAFGGKVSGVARIIKKRADMLDFKQGEIIVSPMTDPSYLSIMKKAKAIITDEGGILCHAAIVARELKIPCIIATKISTRAIKTGDKLKIDATKAKIKVKSSNTI